MTFLFFQQPFVLVVNPGSASPATSSFSFYLPFQADAETINTTAGVSQKVLVTTRDEFGNILTTRMDDWLTMQTSPFDHSFEFFSFSTSYVGNGQFIVTFSILRAFRYKVHIMIEGMNIIRSPFECTVLPSIAVGYRSFNSSIIPNMAIAGKISVFSLQVEGFKCYSCAIF
jgi:hypothetical protein